MNTLLAAGLFLVAFLTLLGCRIYTQAQIDRGMKGFLLSVNAFTIIIEVLSALALLGTIG